MGQSTRVPPSLAPPRRNAVRPKATAAEDPDMLVEGSPVLVLDGIDGPDGPDGLDGIDGFDDRGRASFSGGPLLSLLAGRRSSKSSSLVSVSDSSLTSISSTSPFEPDSAVSISGPADAADVFSQGILSTSADSEAVLVIALVVALAANL